MASASSAPNRDFQFFVEIIDAFKVAGESADEGKFRHMKVEPFAEAMTMFLRIFDAFSNPFFSDIVKKDVQGNIDKLRASASATKAENLESVIEEETKDPKMLKLIHKESGGGQNTGTVALLWMKRTMQFISGLLKNLIDDATLSLSSASRKAYSETLRHCHNIIMRGAFDTGLRFAPTRETFYANLTGGADVQKVDKALRDFLDVYKPQVDAIAEMFLDHKLEPYIKA